MSTTAVVVASGLEIPEGPALMPDGSIIFVQQRLGAVSHLVDGEVTHISRSAGAPNSVTIGSDGCLYAPQNGGVVGEWVAETPATPGIERIHMDGRVELLTAEVAGERLKAPNDLVFGADGRLYFTDPSEPYDPANPTEPNRLYALGPDGGEILITLPPSYTNGLAFMPDGRLVWVESYTRAVCTLEDGARRVLGVLPDNHIPDGLDVALDGRLFIAAIGSNGIAVMSPDGEMIDHLFLDDQAVPSNCCFDGSALWVTDFHVDWATQRNVGRLWRVDTDAEGKPQTPGRL